LPIPVSDFRSNVNDQLAHAAKTIGKGLKRRVFEAIYRGRGETKSVGELCKATGLSRKQVLTAGLALVRSGLVEESTRNHDIAYQKDHNYTQYRDRILSLADDPAKLRKLPTKVAPGVSGVTAVSVSFARDFVNIREVTIDDIDSFAATRPVISDRGFVPMPENRFKQGIQRVLGETGHFQDWGGEQNDLFTTRARIDGSRVTTAIAFKGGGTTGTLTLRKMGKNADQIPRLFESAAQLFLVQYWGQVDQRVYAEMRTYAITKSALRAGSQTIMYGIIDGVDSARIINAYPDAFQSD
jgi:hypothetical protein